MGIINVTPDSFFDGGRTDTAEAAIARGRQLAAEGADILDIGGESTRPGADPVPMAVELARVIPVIEALATLGPTLSVDTRRAEVMVRAVAAGATMINDVSALSHDPESLARAAELAVPVVLMHSRGTPETMTGLTDYADVTLDVYDDLEGRIAACQVAGIDRGRLIIDPGLGFAKTAGQSAELLRRLAVLHGLGCPVLVGASRKSFLVPLAGGDKAEERLPASLAAAIWAASQGAAILRVHDVAATVRALATHRALAGAPVQ
ncbi:MAG: dihydropteroate synthase [Alphaproteobacteria bacterium]|jgi:dihydropteroate synthase|nr:dihydropteroate synthase [Alphaproteobacteria bacterium]MDP6564295.1 dihydropteroate synthase [Alphaproteobacteria bacterium]MDP6811838.1 dihydropteroate synthase [Alphaproteobacteria bacterium]